MKSSNQDPSRKVSAKFAGNYHGKSIFKMNPKAGITLNDDALDVVVDNVVRRIKNTYIHTGMGYARVVDVLVDYNTDKPFRIKDNESLAEETRTAPYTKYYEVLD